MSILCAIGGHEAGAGEVYNCGYWFSRCRRCGRDMIRSGASWDLVPDGHRVVWRIGRGSHSLAPDFAHVLPILHPAANLPMVRPRFASWSRQMVRRRAAAPAAAPAEAAEVAEPPYPGLLVLAAIVGAGLQLLFGLGGRQGL
ncbi:MAG: hypothetical protein JOZ90_15775 [Alphaproteobacteria bacterium]|nr:hypothetical protein [Alphaproteobacteria bacterium]MBV9373405.1 hypothetical protein [Alphaproteobacteria bacterium]MBV9902533.1 hypothetical protein [Alphaproteobacteria bacterium]